jgi:lysophospholipase L1-like esterase
MPPPRRPRKSAVTGRMWLGLAAVALVVLAVAWWRGGATRTPPPLDAARDTVVFLGDSITSGHGLAHAAPGLSGDQTAGGLARLERDVLVHRPTLVVVELGPNDVFRRVPRSETLGNLRAIVRRLREDGAGVLLVHIGLGPLSGGEYLEGFRAIAREEGAWLVEDFLGGVVPAYSADGLHPTEEGHARLAAKLEPVLREILGK